MNTDQIEKRTILEISEALAIAPEEIKPDSSLVTHLGAESIDLVDITFRLEKAFDLTIPNDELFDQPGVPPEKLTLSDITRYIHSKKS